MAGSVPVRQPAGTPTGGQFAAQTQAETGTVIDTPVTSHGYPDGPLVADVFDIDDQFGPLAGFDDGRRWNGFPQPWLTGESLRRVHEVTRGWAQVNSEVEWLDDFPDGVWRLCSAENGPVDVERAVERGPGGEDLYRIDGWCWGGADRDVDDGSDTCRHVTVRQVSEHDVECLDCGVVQA